MYCAELIAVLDYSYSVVRYTPYAVYEHVSSVLNCDLDNTVVVEPCFVLHFM